MEWMLEGNYTAALKEANLQLDSVRNDPSIHYVKGVALYQLKRFKEADSSLCKAIELDPENLAFKESRINCLIELDELKNAEALALEMLSLDSLQITTWLQLSSIYQKQSRLHDAIAVSEILSRQDSCNPYFIKQRGLLYMRMDSIRLSIDEYEKVLSMDSTDLSLYTRLGQLYVRAECSDKVSVLTKGIELDSTIALLYRFRGSLFLMTQSYELAVKDFRAALQYGDTTAFTFRHMGLSLFQLSEYKEALPYFEETIRIDPKDPQAWYYLGVCYKWQENIPKAIECLEISRKLTIPPSLSAIYSGLGQFHGLLRHFDIAMDQYRLCLEFDPEAQMSYAQLGILTEESGGDKKEAFGYYKKFMEVYKGGDLSLRRYVENRMTVIKEQLFMELDPIK